MECLTYETATVGTSSSDQTYNIEGFDEITKDTKMHKPQICSICQKVVAGNLPRHMDTHVKALKCKNCNESFENREDLRR